MHTLETLVSSSLLTPGLSGKVSSQSTSVNSFLPAFYSSLPTTEPSNLKRTADGAMKPSTKDDQQMDPAPPLPPSSGGANLITTKSKPKPPFRPAKDDSKPLLRDPISRSEPIQTEQAMLRLPPFQKNSSQFYD